jgi:hypothetical protein
MVLHSSPPAQQVLLLLPANSHYPGRADTIILSDQSVMILAVGSILQIEPFFFHPITMSIAAAASTISQCFVC